MNHPLPVSPETAQKGQELYERSLHSQVETEANIGKIIVIDIDTGDYEIDTVGFQASRRLRAKHPQATLLGLRIGYEAVEAFGGSSIQVLRQTPEHLTGVAGYAPTASILRVGRGGAELGWRGRCLGRLRWWER